jgi:hypothetical protein
MEERTGASPLPPPPSPLHSAPAASTSQWTADISVPHVPDNAYASTRPRPFSFLERGLLGPARLPFLLVPALVQRHVRVKWLWARKQ